MKIGRLKQRLRKNPSVVSMRIDLPRDVINDLKKVAFLLGSTDCITLLRTYVEQGLRADLERLESTPDVASLIASLKRQGVSEAVIANAVAEAKGQVEAP